MNIKEKIYYFFVTHCPSGRIGKRFQTYFEKKLARACGIPGNGGYAYSETIRQLYKEQHGLQIGYGTFGGCWNNSSLWWKGITIGNYCSFAGDLYIATANHPMNLFTTHPVAYCLEYGAPTGDLDIVPQELLIGNGVWIGQRVLIMAGCHRIGNGAIVGGGAVVTHDVPPYAIVAGNPAKIIRYRFTQEKIERLETSEWWLKDKDTLRDEWNELNELLVQ